VTERGHELISMGLRANPETLKQQLEMTGQLDSCKLPYHRAIMKNEIPLCGGGRRFRHGAVGIREGSRLQRLETLHVSAIRIRAQTFTRTFGIVGVVVALLVLIPLQRTEGPGGSLNLARLGHHQAVPLRAGMVKVAGTTRVFVDPRTARIGVEVSPSVCALLARSCRIAAMANDTTGRIAQPTPHSHDLPHHLAVGLADRLEALMACQATGFLRVWVSRLTVCTSGEHEDRKG